MNPTDPPLCLVCGARRRFGNSPTCDSICARARKARRTRAQQIKADIVWSNRLAAEEEREQHNHTEIEHRYIESNDYNRPYMHG